MYIDLEKCYANFPVTENGVISAKYRLNHKGDYKEKPIKPKSKNFLNCVTLSIQTDKKINVKIFNNGVFQFTGCKVKSHVIDCMNIILSQMVRIECYTLNDAMLSSCCDTSIIYYIISAMRNIDFELGFPIDRKMLGTMIAAENSTYSIPPMTTGYMGVKIKIPISDTTTIVIPKIEFNRETRELIETCVAHDILYKTAFPMKRKLKTYFVSISVFQNGKVLMSGIDESIQKPCYDWFMTTIDRLKPIISVHKVIKTFRR